MGAAYFIVLDRDVDFDSFVNGKALAKNAEPLNRDLASAGLSQIDDFVSFGVEEIEAATEELGVDGKPDWYTGEQWFEPGVGIEWVAAVRAQIGNAPGNDALVAELEEYHRVLEQARSAGAMWHPGGAECE